MAATAAQAYDLWKRAVDSLDPNLIAGLDPAKTGVRDIVTAVFRVAQAKRDDSMKKRWRISRRDKQDVIVRDVMEKIIFWIDRFKDIGDNAVQHEPGHAALPWAAIRFILQAAVNYTEVEREILEGIELVARLLASFREVEKIYLGASVLEELQNALVDAYATILETLAEAVRYFSESKKVHALKAGFRMVGGENTRKLLTREQQVLRFTKLVDGQRLLDVATKVDRSAELSAITEKAVDEQKYQAILRWLSTSKYLEHHDEQRKLRTPGTGTWLLRHAEYVSWQQESSSSTLIVHGIPGCGKTILCSLTVDESISGQKPGYTKAPLAFFYCSASASEPDRRNAASILRSLVRQLTIAASRYPKIHSAVLAVYEIKSEAAKLHGFDLAPLHVHECEDLIVAALEDNPATIIVDALDEMDNPHDLIGSLQTISTRARNVVKVLITTRDSSQVEHTIPHARMVQITLAENQSDVEQFITLTLDQMALRRGMSQVTRNKLVESLVSGAGEMFQWAKLQLSQLQASKQLAIEYDLTDQLSRFAKSTLDELYSTIFRVLLESGEATREIVVHTFSWILYAQEPLSMDALLTAIAGGSGQDTLSPEGVLDICRGFMHVDSQSRIVRFDHQSVRSFLHTQAPFSPQQAQTLIVLSCLRIFREPPLDDTTDLQSTEKAYDYAALYFGHHVSILDAKLIHDSTTSSIDSFLFDQSETGLYANIWLEHILATYDSLPRAHVRKSAMEAITSESSSPLFPICVFNMISILKTHPWPPAFDWDQRNKSGYTALYAASYFGHAEVVLFLLDHHADPNVECGRLGSPVQCAAYRGHDDVVRVLLDRGADPMLKRHFESAVHAACKGNNEDVVVSLLQRGFKISTREEYKSIESEIAKAGLAQAMTELQRHPLNAKVAIGRVVQLATNIIARGEVNGLNYLLRKSPLADVIPPGSLSTSALYGHEKMTIFLIDQGLDVNEAGKLGNPLRNASINGHNNICNILLNRGANVDDNGPFGSALHAAAMRGHLHTAKLLLDIGADVNIRGGYYGTPLQAAAFHGHIELIHLLLAVRASVHATGLFQDAIHAAVEGGHHAVVKLFLEAGYQPLTPLRDTRARCSRPGPLPPNILRDLSPTRRSRTRLHQDEPLIDPIASLDPLDLAGSVPAYFGARKGAKRSPGMLETASALGHRDVVAIILAEKSFGLEKDAPQFALATACHHGHFGVVEEMTSGKYSLDLDLQEGLHQATLGGHSDIVRTLLSQLVEQETSADLFETVLVTSMPESPRIFTETMQRMRTLLSPSDAQGVLSKCLSKAAKAGRAGTVKAIVAELPMITPESLTDAFKRACNVGGSAVASIIYSSLDPAPVSTPQLVGRTRAAARDGFKDLLQFLLSKCVEVDLEDCIESMICLAAGDGLLEVIMVLLSWGARRQLADQTALDTALAVSAQNGHEEVCAFLMSQGANPIHSVCVPVRSHLATKRRRVLAPENTRINRVPWDWKTSDSGSESDGESDDDSDSASSFVSLRPETVEPDGDAVQLCLAGYERFQCRSFSEPRHGSSWHFQDEAAQTRTLRGLLDGVVGFDERHWSRKICTAAEFCPPEALEILLQKVVSSGYAMSLEKALQVAATREHWNHSIMQLLLQAGADQDLGDADLRELLSSSLAQFDHPSTYDGLFSAVPSLDELFVSGCGAVVEYLLRRLPLENASGNGYDVLLQAAAAAGELELVELLIARNIDVNAIVSHYGTALQAACRWAHTDVAEALLKAGADPNLIRGKYCTALRAAVTSGSLSTVLLLLQFEADTGLTGPCRSRAGDLQPTALYLAVQEKHTSIALALVDAGASVKDAHNDAYVPTLLASACEWGDCSVVRRLVVEAGADLQAFSTRRHLSSAYTSAMHAAICFAHHDVVQLLISCGFNLTAAFSRAEESGDLLTLAVYKEDTAIVTTLLQHLPRGCDAMLLRASKAAIERNLYTTLVQLLDVAWDGKSASTLLDLSRTACHTPHESIVELLFGRLSTLDCEPDLSSALATIDVRELNPELLECFLCYTPYTIELFVEACIRGDLDLVQRGINVGHRPDSEDKWARSPLHLAAAQGRASVVQLLLEAGTDVNCAHATRGTALVTALEGLSADELTTKSTEESDRSYAAELAELENLRHDFIYADSSRMDRRYISRGYRCHVPFEKPRKFRASKKGYAKTISLLLSNGARVDNYPGRFGTALTLAAFAGLEEACDLLILHGAKAGVTGGVLESPLSAAIDQGHMKIVDRLLSVAKSSGYVPGPGDTSLHRACKIGNPTLVGKLLDLGHKPSMADSEGKTALQISLQWLKPPWEATSDRPSIIVHMLMEADARPIMSADEMVAVAEIKDSQFQRTLMDRILASIEQHRVPEEILIRFLQTKNRSILRQILDKRAVTSVTTAMLASACDVDTLTLLLECDPSYAVTSATIDAIQTGRAEETRKMAEVLLLRNPSLHLTESQVCKALSVEYGRLTKWSNGEKTPLLDLAFGRNPDLSVTEKILESVRNPCDLKVLLAHLDPGKPVVTERVLRALHPPREHNEHSGYAWDHENRREYSDELLQILLDFEPSARISSEIAQQFFEDRKMDTVERLLNHDNSIIILPENVSSIIGSISLQEHYRFIEVLEKHPGQYLMSDEVKTIVESRFQQQSERELKEMYYKLAGWTSIEQGIYEETGVS
jgi:ankyrin repeat protein